MSHFSREISRELLDEYRNLFEYDLTPVQEAYWKVVVINSQKISSDQKSNLEKYYSKEELRRINSTLEYLPDLTSHKTRWVPQSVKEDIVYFMDLNVYDYFHSWQAPILEQAKGNRKKYE